MNSALGCFLFSVNFDFAIAKENWSEQNCLGNVVRNYFGYLPWFCKDLTEFRILLAFRAPSQSFKWRLYFMLCSKFLDL